MAFITDDRICAELSKMLKEKRPDLDTSSLSVSEMIPTYATFRVTMGDEVFDMRILTEAREWTLEAIRDQYLNKAASRLAP